MVVRKGAGQDTRGRKVPIEMSNTLPEKLLHLQRLLKERFGLVVNELFDSTEDALEQLITSSPEELCDYLETKFDLLRL